MTQKDPRQFFIYTHARPDGSVFYVGKGCNGRDRDFWGRRPHHKNIVAKYGKENIIVRTFNVYDELHAYECERMLIKALVRAGIELCNTGCHGEGVIGRRPVSAETREKLRQALLGRPRPPEVIAKMKESRKKSTYVHSEATRKKLSAWKRSPEHLQALMDGRKGKPVSEETRAKISDALRGRKLTKETKEKLRQSHLGIKPSPETVAKRSISIKATYARKKGLTNVAGNQ